MQISSIPVPAVYKEESADFRFFLKWFELALSKIQYDTEEFFDLFDPLRCPEDLLWMLGDTMGYKYDSRMTPAFNRLALVYFMSMIRLKGSKDGVTLSAQVNLDQFKLQDQAAKNSILNNRLDDTSIPVNSVYVQPNVEAGYIDLIYFSDELPVDACTEYTRPIGMYMVPHAGVRYDAKDRLIVDARLTNTNDLKISIGSTRVGHYSQDDYSRMQRLQLSDLNTDGTGVRNAESAPRASRRRPITPLSDQRQPVWYRNSKYETLEGIDYGINPGYRALYSLQLANSGETAQSLLGRVQATSLFNPARPLSSITPDDVLVYDSTENTIYDNNYYTSLSRRRDAVPHVESRPLGTMGDAMVTSNPTHES